MSVKLYMDENVPRQITLGLRLRGLDVLTVQEDNRLGLPDPQVLDRATELQRVLFSRDDDLLVIANQRQQNGTTFYGVIYAHT
jgi:predicted nuclease of predicted toxin-antitoxin system